MSSLNYEDYEQLKKIEDSAFISTMQNIKKEISDSSSPLPNRLICINLLRAMCKYHAQYFFNFFWGMKKNFIKNCLKYEENPKLQQISILFINEILFNILNEIPYENANDLILWIFENIFLFLKSNNTNLKSHSENFIRNMAENIPNEAIVISLIKSLKEKDDNINSFLYNCIELYFKEFVSYGLNFDFIIDKLEINKIFNEEEYKDYYMKYKKVFILLKNILKSQGININTFSKDLDNKNKGIFIELIKE